MAEIAILRHSDSGYRHGACDIAHYGLRPHQFTPTQPRAGLFAACRFSCILLELAICSDRNLAPTLLCLLLFYTSDKRFKTFKYREYHTTCNPGRCHRICDSNCATCAYAPTYGRARGRAFSGSESHRDGPDERIRGEAVAASDSRNCARS